VIRKSPTFVIPKSPAFVIRKPLSFPVFAVLALLSATSALCVASAFFATPARAATGVSVYPIPGTKYNLPRSQIVFRGIPASMIGQVQVVGSVTGTHTGRIAPDSDGAGGSFLPDKPFAGGEKVTVTTGLNVIGGRGGVFSFAIAHPAGSLAYGALPLVAAGSNGVQQFRSRPDLRPAAVTVTKNSAPASYGDIFVAPQFGPSQDGPMILDPQGNLVWFKSYPVGENTLIADFRVQTLEGQPVLTWWQGNTNAGHGRGVGVIYNRNYEQLATVHAVDGVDMDLHEFRVTPQGDAYFNTSVPVHLPGIGKPTVVSVIQEIDIKTGLLLFEWNALDHVPIGESYITPKTPGFNFDPYHVNSIEPDRDGNLIVSMRDTSAVYKINHDTGAIIWRLGGKHSNFTMGRGTPTAFQHNAIVQPDGSLTLFDDGAGPPTVHPESRGVRISLDTTHNTATLVKEYDHSPQLSADFEGSLQALPSGDVFLGWGQQPYFSEDDAAGQQVFDAHFNAPTSSYRAYRFPWSGQPTEPPSLALVPVPDGTTNVHASWNGATNVTAWRVLSGPSPATLTTARAGPKRGFETLISVPSSPPYVAVQALGSSGNVLATSAVTSTPPHIAIYGHSAFVSGGGYGAVPASCYQISPCELTTTISAGGTVIARTGKESLGKSGVGVVYFGFSSQGRAMLARAPGHRLAVQVSTQGGSRTASTTVELIPFATTGPGPHRTVTESSNLQIIGATDYVSASGVGGILTACLAPTPCHVAASLSIAGATIAHTGTEFLGANELGYLIFSLTPTGRSMLAHAPGNQLGAQLTITDGTDTASGNIGLVGFG
jgi:hypothetical protein